MRRNYSGFFTNMNSGVIVIKVGTSSLVNPESGTLRLSILAMVCEVVKNLKEQGYHVLLVSSGAVGVGCQQLKMKDRPKKMAQKQALASVGQLHLMRHYDDFFAALGLTCAQVLLSNDNFVNRHQYLNAKSAFRELLNYGTVPIVNENDAVAVDHLRIGDNDTLSAKVANMVEASWLFILTDVECLYTNNPRTDPTAKPIHEVEDMRDLNVDVSSSGTQWGCGGMSTKLTAARLATAGGCKMAICKSTQPDNILRIMNTELIGTVFHSLGAPITSKERKKWILNVPVKGQLWLDDGAVRAVLQNRKSLFAAGIKRVVGDFGDMDAVSLCNEEGAEFGIGICNYAHHAVRKVIGKKSTCFREELEGHSADEMVHRHNICILASAGGDGYSS